MIENFSAGEETDEVLTLDCSNQISHSYLLGIYKKVPNLTINENSVWKHVSLNFYLYFDGKF